jgi:hypothetical protein
MKGQIDEFLGQLFALAKFDPAEIEISTSFQAQARNARQSASAQF